MLLGHGVHEPYEEGSRAVTQVADAHELVTGAGDGPDALLREFPSTQQGTGLLQEDLTGICQLDAVRVAHEEERAERFLESIRAEGEAACAAIREETERAINTQLDETRRTENTRVERTLRFETERAKTRANRDLSAARMAARATLAAQRQKIADETFSKAREQLAAFVAGKDYAAWLQKEAASLAETLGENAKVTARAADLPLLKNVRLPAGTVLEADDSITLGGLKGANPAKGVAADDTLEARLEAQHDWFLENAGLEINI